MKFQFWSRTKIGKWANSLTLVFITFMALKLINLEIIRVPIPTPFIAIIGLIGFIIGLISIIKKKDKALLTLLSILIGVLIIFWTIAEIMFPH